MSHAMPHASEVLVGTPRVGLLGEVEENLYALTRARDAAEAAALVLRQSAELLHGSTTATSDRVRHRLTEELLPAVSALDLTTDDAQRAFATYLARLTDLYARADRVELRVTGALDLIGWDRARVAAIAAARGLAAAYPWDTPPPSELPDGSDGSDGSDGAAWRSAGLAHDRADWRSAVHRWEATLAALAYDRRDWAGLIADREAAEIALRRACDRTAVGELLLLAAATGDDIPAVLGAHLLRRADLRVWNGREPTTAHPLLRSLIGTESGADIWDAPPPAEQVAAAWLALPEAHREALIVDVPWVIGNLPGVPFADRDRANRIMLGAYLAHQAGLNAPSRRALADAVTILTTPNADPPRSLLALDLSDGMPRVAIGYGSPDTAGHLTWGVPGMLSDAHRALPAWDRAMASQYAAQVRGLGASGTTPALIAFLSYDTPNLVTVLGERAARSGATRLAAELDGAAAARALGVPLATHGALAHSYGTTTLVTAVERLAHPLDHITLVASPGLDPAAGARFDALRVARDAGGNPRVYTTLAATDALAPLGAELSGRLQPHPHPWRGPGLAIGPSYAFSSDGWGRYRATQGHAITNATGTGYFDAGTQSHAAIAALAIGRPDRVPGGLERILDRAGDAAFGIPRRAQPVGGGR